MSIASVLIPSHKPTGSTTSSSATPRYSLLLSTDPGMIEAAQRLRYDVFSSTPGFALPAADQDGRDVDRFDEFCDHLLVRDDDTGELVGCYRMLGPAGAIAAGGLLGCLLGAAADGWEARSQLAGAGGGGKSVSLKMVVDYQTVAAGMLFTLVMGRLGGLVPALSAMRMEILDSLR